MDIFNRKRVKELEQEVKRLKKLERECDELRSDLSVSDSNLRNVLKIKDEIPDDCIPGTYCQACEFGKEYYYHRYSYYGGCNTIITGYLCNKANVCKSFIQKEVNNGDCTKV